MKSWKNKFNDLERDYHGSVEFVLKDTKNRAKETEEELNSQISILNGKYRDNIEATKVI